MLRLYANLMLFCIRDLSILRVISVRFLEPVSMDIVYTIICSAKGAIRQYCYCANTREHTYTDYNPYDFMTTIIHGV